MNVKRYYDTKIGKIIEEEFDSRMENVVFSYIIDKGSECICNITNEDIDALEGNGLMSKEFIQSLVRCAKRICCECNYNEIIEYIRLYLNCNPPVREVILYKEDFTKESFAELLNDLNIDEDEVGNEIALYAVVDEDYL